MHRCQLAPLLPAPASGLSWLAYNFRANKQDKIGCGAPSGFLVCITAFSQPEDACPAGKPSGERPFPVKTTSVHRFQCWGPSSAAEYRQAVKDMRKCPSVSWPRQPATPANVRIHAC